MNPLSLGAGLMAGTSLTAAVLAQAASGDPSGIGPYVGGGAGVVAVGALAEVTRRLLNGSLIPRVTREMEQEMTAYITAAGQREDRAMKVAEDASGMVARAAMDLREHNAKVAADLAAVTRRQAEQMAEMVGGLTRATEDLRDELRDLRRGGQQ